MGKCEKACHTRNAAVKICSQEGVRGFISPRSVEVPDAPRSHQTLLPSDPTSPVKSILAFVSHFV